jgi:hypothetical protein
MPTDHEASCPRASLGLGIRSSLSATRLEENEDSDFFRFAKPRRCVGVEASLRARRGCAYCVGYTIILAPRPRAQHVVEARLACRRAAPRPGILLSAPDAVTPELSNAGHSVYF